MAGIDDLEGLFQPGWFYSLCNLLWAKESPSSQAAPCTMVACTRQDHIFPELGFTRWPSALLKERKQSALSLICFSRANIVYNWLFFFLSNKNCMSLQKVYVWFIAETTIRVKLHCFTLSCFLSAFRSHCLWSQAGDSFFSANVLEKNNSTVMYLCNGIKHIINAISQTEYCQIGFMLMQYYGIKEKTQGTAPFL